MNRHRESLDFNQSGTIIHYTNGSPTGNTPTIVNRIQRVMDDVVVPDFDSRLKGGEYIVNPCTYVVTSELTEGSGRYRADHKTNGTVLENYGTGCLSRSTSLNVTVSQRYVAISLPSGWGSSQVDAAMSKCLADIDKTPYSFAEDIAEWRQTLSFMRDPLKSLKGVSASFSREVSKLMLRRKALTRAKALSDVYLTWRFAFSPLVRTIDNLSKAYVSQAARPRRRSARGFADDTFSKFENQTRGAAGNNLYWFVERRTHQTVHAVIGYEVSNPIADWRFKYGLRFKDIPETMWAVFPMSFMYDRVFNISDAIRGLTNLADPSVSILGGSVTTRRDDDSSFSFYKQLHSSYNTSTTPDVAISKSFTYSRVKWTPTVFNVIPPSTVGNLWDTSLKAADLLSLVIQRLK